MTTTSTPSRIIRLREVINRVGLCRATIYNLIKKGQFPNQVSLGLNSVGWIESEVQTWIDIRISASRSNQAA
ncbi:MAG: AlpA family transcriptional regulator [Pseudomonadales bacterium]|nr:AlpA family transcriptional regulator [Pseudomonadales bacterium]